MVVMPNIDYFVASVLTMLLLADVRMENITHWAILIADNDTFQLSPLLAVPHIWLLAWSVLYLLVFICVFTVRLVSMLDTSFASSVQFCRVPFGLPPAE